MQTRLLKGNPFADDFIVPSTFLAMKIEMFLSVAQASDCPQDLGPVSEGQASHMSFVRWPSRSLG